MLVKEKKMKTPETILQELVETKAIKRPPAELLSLCVKISCTVYDCAVLEQPWCKWMDWLKPAVHTSFRSYIPNDNHIIELALNQICTVLGLSSYSSVNTRVPVYDKKRNVFTICDFVGAYSNSDYEIINFVVGKGDYALTIDHVIRTALQRLALQENLSLKTPPPGRILVFNTTNNTVWLFNTDDDLLLYFNGHIDSEPKKKEEPIPVLPTHITIFQKLKAYEEKLQLVIPCNIHTAEKKDFEKHLDSLPYFECFLNCKSKEGNVKYRTETSIVYAKMRSIAFFFAIQKLGYKVLTLESHDFEGVAAGQYVKGKTTSEEGKQRWDDMYITKPHAQRFFEELNTMSLISPE